LLALLKHFQATMAPTVAQDNLTDHSCSAKGATALLRGVAPLATEKGDGPPMTAKDLRRNSICHYFNIEKSLVHGREVFNQPAIDAVLSAVRRIVPDREEQNALLASIALDYAELGKHSSISPQLEQLHMAALKARILKVYRNTLPADGENQDNVH
jgi:hypothetical protein